MLALKLAFSGEKSASDAMRTCASSYEIRSKDVILARHPASTPQKRNIAYFHIPKCLRHNGIQRHAVSPIWYCSADTEKLV
jgi:hypothetical protein